MKTIALKFSIMLLYCDLLMAQAVTTRNETVHPPRDFTGQWVAWYPNGQKKCECRYIAGKSDGKWVYWDDKGEKTTEIGYDKGKVHGLYSTWHKNAQLSSQATFEHDELKQPWVYWTPEGILKHGIEVTFYEPGKKQNEAHFVKGKRHGMLTHWNPSGQKLHEEPYRDGVLHGLSKSWHDNGTVSSETPYQAGKKHGRQSSWYPNGWKEHAAVYDQGKLVERIPVPGDDDPKAWGADRAKADLAQGIQQIYQYGLPSDDPSGLPIVIVAGCDVQATFAAKINAYNATMRAAAKAEPVPQE